MRVDTYLDPTRLKEKSVFGVFKGMGDLMSVAPAIIVELNSGKRVTVIVFAAVRSIVDLLDWQGNRDHLDVVTAPSSSSIREMFAFIGQLASLNPNFVWISPHAPAAARSWKVPLVVWIIKGLFWRNAIVAGVDSERFSRLFDVRVPVDRRLPLAAREWTAYSMIRNNRVGEAPGLKFRPDIERHRDAPRELDILIHPGANAANRKWPADHFAELIGMIPVELRVGLVGLQSDIEPIKEAMAGGRAIEFYVGSLTDAITAMAKARVLLSMDSGTTFFARALRVPTVALFGPVNPVSVLASNDTMVAIYEQRWSCQPCGNSTCQHAKNYCMIAIEPRQVLLSIMSQLRISMRGEAAVVDERNGND